MMLSSTKRTYLLLALLDLMGASLAGLLLLPPIPQDRPITSSPISVRCWAYRDRAGLGLPAKSLEAAPAKIQTAALPRPV
jgi:hypothetical protein